MKWPWNYIKEKREEKERIESEISRKVAELNRLIEKQKQKEHDSHIVDSLNTYNYRASNNYVKLNYMDDGSVEFRYCKEEPHYPSMATVTTILLELTKDEIYLIGEFLHEHNNKS